ncbi:STM4504/CBY_0614 family protein [Pseudomonas aeruginosa]
MPVIDLYSKRRKRELGLLPDVYTYDNFTSSLRTQICYVISDALGIQDQNEKEINYESICEVLRREYGVYRLVSDLHPRTKAPQELLNFISCEQDIDRVLDAVELSFLVAESYRGRAYVYGYSKGDPSAYLDECVSEINSRFKEHGKGYEISSGKVLRIDSELLHNEIVKPAINFLNQVEYAGPRDEFFSAYEHYRHGNIKEALNDALKAFESTIKVVLELRGWEYDKTSPAKRLLAALLANKFLPSYHQNHLNALSTLLESSVPTIRNKEGGHGQGSEVSEVEPEVAAYVLHMTASAIVMLCSLEKKSSKPTSQD